MTDISLSDETLKKHILHERRRAGILLHPTSLPGPYPRGLICHDAYRFVEFLEQAGITVWQMLPLAITHSDLSPYQALSSHACEPSLISLDWLRDRGLLKQPSGRYTFAEHQQHLKDSYNAFGKKKSSKQYQEYQDFIEQHNYWLDDYAVFMAIREEQGNKPWFSWPKALRDRNKKVIEATRRQLQDVIDYHQFTQFVFFQQWLDLKEYARAHGVILFGDLPIYVAHDSSDVWIHRELFLLDKDGQPQFVAGVPPDYFSETGQRWGNPQYNWKAMQDDDFVWWKRRIRTQLELFDVVRIDHFRGFEAYWEIDAAAETAIDGRWVKAPGNELLQQLHDEFHSLPLVAEDLGIITDEVTQLREQFDLPGMKVLQFAFDGDPANVYLPSQHEFNSVVYTGTHDNDTTLSWYQQLDPSLQEYIYRYLNCNPAEAMPWSLIKSALASVACLAVFPMQDILGLGQGHRMNTPGTTEDNWQWRFDWDQVPADLAQKISDLCRMYNR
jgi:4-alpha-glucanotransferase